MPRYSACLTPSDAQRLQDKAALRGVQLLWVVSTKDPEYAGKITARSYLVGQWGGIYWPGALVADTIDLLRAMLPARLTRFDRVLAHPPWILETWASVLYEPEERLQ